MPRARQIKYQFFTSEEIVTLSPYSRLLFIGLWTLADREGKLEYRPTQIKCQLFPNDNVNILELFSELLVNKHLLTVFEVEGVNYLIINNFRKHQTPFNNEKPSNIPDPTEDMLYNCLDNAKHLLYKDMTQEGLVSLYPCIPVSLYPREKKKKKIYSEPLPNSGPQTEKPEAKPEAKPRAVDFLDLFPEDFQTNNQFAESWKTWITHRKEIHKTIKETTAKSQAKKLIGYGIYGSIATIDNSICNGWAGLFPPKEMPDPNEKPPPSQYEKSIRRIELELKDRIRVIVDPPGITPQQFIDSQERRIHIHKHLDKLNGNPLKDEYEQLLEKYGVTK